MSEPNINQGNRRKKLINGSSRSSHSCSNLIWPPAASQPFLTIKARNFNLLDCGRKLVCTCRSVNRISVRGCLFICLFLIGHLKRYFTPSLDTESDRINLAGIIKHTWVSSKSIDYIKSHFLWGNNKFLSHFTPAWKQFLSWATTLMFTSPKVTGLHISLRVYVFASAISQYSWLLRSEPLNCSALHVIKRWRHLGFFGHMSWHEAVLQVLDSLRAVWRPACFQWGWKPVTTHILCWVFC